MKAASHGTVFCMVTAGFVLSLVGCAQTPPPPEVTPEGLVRKEVKGIDMAYIRPDANLSAYKKVMLDKVDVSFSKDWDPERTGSRMKLSQEERDKIKNDLGQLFADTFKKELEKDGGYPVVDAPGPDVLRLTAGLADVYINAPDTMEPGRSRTYTMSAGHMTLVAELRDSETGQLLAQVADLTETRNDQFLTVSNSVTNSADARNAVANWAKILRARMDAVRMENLPMQSAKPQ